jgi:hypothetical protein
VTLLDYKIGPPPISRGAQRRSSPSSALRLAEKAGTGSGKSSFQSADREAAFLKAVRLAGFGIAEAHPPANMVNQVLTLGRALTRALER